MKRKQKKMIAILLMMAILFTSIGKTRAEAANAASKVKNACSAALKATGNAKKIKYKSTTPSDFDAISYKYNKKVSAMFFVTSDNTVYNICVAQGKSANDAKTLYKAFAQYKENQIHGLYFDTDFSKAEQNVMKNAIYGRKGKFVWYISMSSKKKNLAGETALKKKI
ncbi:MAG: hypothetical protein IJ733_18620 [Lachnospiraceae bacterium]|nr:hypothetical protein [Lachnospiraceae bacterium]